MAFPQIAGSQLSNEAANTTNHDVTLPASVAAGDLLIAVVFHDGNSTFTWPGSWQELADGNIGTVASMTVGYLIASGGETTVAVTSTGSERSTHIAVRITGWHGTTPPEISTATTGTSTAPNSGSVTASWGSADNLFIALYGVDSGNVTAYALPDNNIASQTTASAAYGAICSDELAQATLDPGAFTNSASDDWRAYTIVVRPAAGGGVTTTRAHAQAQAWIEQTYNVHGQAQARVKQTYNVHGQSQARIKQTYPLCTGGGGGGGGAILGSDTMILGDIVLGSISSEEEEICIGAFGQAQALIIGSHYVHGQAQANIEQTYYVHGQSNAWIKNTYFAHGQSNALIIGAGYAHGQCQATIKTTYYQHGQAQAYLEGTEIRFGQAQAQIKQTYPLCVPGEGGDGSGAILGSDTAILGEMILGSSESGGGGETCIGAFGQAQATILSSATKYAHGQSQAWIENIYYGHGQSQAWIENTYYSHGQAQAQIKQVYYVHGQAQGLIGGAEQKFGQAQATIIPQYIHFLDTFTRTVDPAETTSEINPPDVGTYYPFTSAGPNAEIDGSVLRVPAIASGGNILLQTAVDISSSSATTVSWDIFSDDYTDRFFEVFISENPNPSNKASVYMFDDGDIFLDTDTNSDSSTFTFVNGTTYRIVLFVNGTEAKAKIWDVSTPEPSAWLLETTTPVFTVRRVIWQGEVDGNFTVDNVSVYAPEPPAQYKFGQARAFIGHFKHGQAQAWIETTANRHGQAQALILSPVVHVHGQAVGRIASAILVDTFTRTVAGPITTNVAQVNPPDIGSYTNFNSSGASITGSVLQVIGASADYDFYELRDTDIRVEGAYVSADFSTTNMDAVNATPISIILLNDIGGNINEIVAEITAGNFELNQYNGVNSVTASTAFSITNSTNYRIKFLVNYPTILAKAWNLANPEPGWMLSIDVTGRNANLPVYVSSIYGDTGEVVSTITLDNVNVQTINPPGTRVYGQARAVVAGAITKSGQAQAKINAFGVNKHGQAQATIFQSIGVTKHGQAQAVIFRPVAQAQAYIVTHNYPTGQANAYIFNYWRKHSQAQGLIRVGGNTKSGQANALISSNIHLVYGQAQGQIESIVSAHGQAQALITKGRAYGQSQAWIEVTTRGHGQALALISRHQSFGQAQAEIRRGTETKVYGQAQAFIEYAQNAHAQAQAMISKGAGHGQAQARINAFGNLKSGNSQAFIRRTDTRFAHGQAQAQLRRNDFTGQAQAFISGGRYIVKFNGYQMPGYAQLEDLQSIESIIEHDAAYQFGPFSEYIGLENKVISLQMKVVGETYIDVKNQVQTASTIARSAKGWAKLYIQRGDRHYLALTKAVRTSKTVGQSMRLLDYTLDFEAKPWLISDTIHVISGASLSDTDQVLRNYDSGGWTPARVIVTGNNVTISGYTETGEFTGFITISGAVTGMVIDSDEYTAEILGENANNVMYRPNYRLYVGPGKTYFVITGATDCVIEYYDRWYL